MKKITLFILLVFTTKIFAQTELHCGTDKLMNKRFATYPDLKAKFEQRELLKKNSTKNLSTGGIYTIPIVFHILHHNGAENIDDSQIHDAVRILNRDFAKQNADTSVIIPSFKSIADSTGIQFVLATLDPNGNCTNGIIHYFDVDADWSDTSFTTYSHTWDPTKYLNVYVVKTITMSDGFQAAGYTYLPGSFAYGDPWDAVVVLHNYLGSIGTSSSYTSRVLTHEVGHWLNLLHVFGWNNAATDCSSDDYVNDTPTTPGYLNCPTISNVASYQQCMVGVDENFQNYMDYSYCSKMFTHDQGQRMRDALNDNSVGRDNLWSSSNLTATGVGSTATLCKADFKSNNVTNTVCQGNSLTFSDLSWNGNPTTWNWSFQGGTPAISTDSAPSILYSTPGTYNVSLTVGNNTGSKSITKLGFVTVNSATAMITTPSFSESFESGAIPNNLWNVRNPLPAGNTWVQTNTAAATGTKSIMIRNTDSSNAAVDELISPSIKMNTIAGNNPVLTFKVAHAQKTSASTDKLQVYASTNCGASWTLRKTLSGAALSTAGIQSISFVPTANQWVKQSISLVGYSSQANLYLMFRFTSNGGNHIYIDDINIGDTTLTGIIDEPANTLDFNVYPNPIEKNTVISFSIFEKQKIELTLDDINGRKISTIYTGSADAGEHQYALGENASSLSSGTYLITLSMGDKRFTKKLIVK